MAEHICNFCKKSFIRESSLINHTCEKKRRWMNKEEKYVKLGFYAYQKFYTLNYPGQKPKDYADFVESNYYTAFTGFGHHIIKINAINTESFIDFVLKNQVKIEDWTKDYVYETYVREFTRKEDPLNALERAIVLMESWAKLEDKHWTDFFTQVNTNIAVLYIKNGRLSPWIIFSSKSAKKLFDRFNDDQLIIINNAIDIKNWKLRVFRNQNAVKTIDKILTDAGC